MPLIDIQVKACYHVGWRICNNDNARDQKPNATLHQAISPTFSESQLSQIQLTAVRNDLADQLLLLSIVVRANLGRKGKLHRVIVLVHNHNVDVVRLALEHPRCDALLAQPDSGLLDLVQENGGNGLVDLELEVLGPDDIDGRDKSVHDKRKLVAVVDVDSVGLALDDDDDAVTPADEDRLGDGAFDLDVAVGGSVVFLERC